MLNELIPARVGLRAGLRARGLRPVGGGGDAGRLHPGHDARRRAARGRRATSGVAGGRTRPERARRRRSRRRSSWTRRARAARGERVLEQLPARGAAARAAAGSWRRRWASRRARADDGQPLQRHADTPDRRRCAQAMAHAEVGDEQRLDDPTVNALQERVAELLGKEAALFLPSGTMCNAIAFRLHVRPGGDEVILDRTSHPVQYEAGGPAALSGAMLQRARRRRRHLHRGAGGGSGAAGRRPLRAALAARVGRADDQHRRRARVAARHDPRGARGRVPRTGCGRTSTAPG